MYGYMPHEGIFRRVVFASVKVFQMPFSDQNAPFDDKSKRQMTEISLTEQCPQTKMYKAKILFSL